MASPRVTHPSLAADSTHPAHRFANGPRRLAPMVARIARTAMVGLVVALTGCGTLLRNPVPAPLAYVASIPNMPDVRAWAGQPAPAMERDLADSFRQESPAEFPPDASGVIHYAHLALSGGGANGAFGAGFLNGWTAKGTRPLFKTVTGVSTGALMAPFAFLGPSYDNALREFYTTTSSRDIFIVGSLFSLAARALSGEALADTGPLVALIERHVDAELVRRVAEAHARGRRLYIGTVDLDAQRFVVWNMGLIASSSRPEALVLFRQVMLASASIPIAFPPVFFDVEADGQRYDEMHVDGGVGARVFSVGGLFRASLVRQRGGLGGAEVREDFFVIHNGQLFSAPRPTRRTVLGIAMRVLDASSHSAVHGDLWRIHATALYQSAGFHWVTIPDGTEIAGEETFDPIQMRALYDIGYRSALAGPAWETRPPGFVLETSP
jgi:hypothetical protein